MNKFGYTALVNWSNLVVLIFIHHFSSAQLSGNYTIGTGGDFTSFIEAVDTLNVKGVNGPVIFDVNPLSGPYKGRLELDSIPGVSAANTIVFNCNGAVVTDTTMDTLRHVLLLNGAKYVTFDSLQIVCTGVHYGFGILLTNRADHNTFRKCVVDMTAMNMITDAKNSAGIAASNSLVSPSSTGHNASHCTFEENLIKGGASPGLYYGMILLGTPGNVGCVGNIIRNNIIQDVYVTNLILYYTDSTLVSGNDISRPGKTGAANLNGIMLQGGNQNVIIENNRIHNSHDVAISKTSTAIGIRFIGSDAPVGKENLVRNNLIYNFNNNGGSVGISNQNSNGAYYYHNTISLDYVAAIGGTAIGLTLTSAATNVEFLNNNVSITKGGVGVKRGIYFSVSTAGIVCDYNNIYLNSAGSGVQYFGVSTSGSFTTLATWQAANSGLLDQHTIGEDPNFANMALSDYTPTNKALNGICNFLSDVTEDINGVSRNMNGPDPGAIEFYNGLDIGVISLDSPSSSCMLGTEDIVVKIANFNNIDVNPPIYVNYVVNGGTVNTDTILSVIVANDTIQHTFTDQYNLSANGTYTIEAYTTLIGDLDVSNDSITETVHKTLVPALSLGNDTTACEGDTIFLKATAGFDTYDWGISNAQTLKVDTTGSYHVIATDSVGCIVKDTIMIEFFDVAKVNLGNDTIVCTDVDLILDAGPGNGYIYDWNTPDTTQTVQLNGKSLGPGTYYYSVSVTTSKGCSTFDEINVTYIKGPEANLPESDTLCDTSSIQLFNWAIGLGIKYFWSTGDTSYFITLKGADLVYGINIISVLTVANNGCFERDTTLLFLESCTGITERYLSEPAMTVFPNPSQGTFNVQLDEYIHDKAMIEVFNSSGQIIFRENIDFEKIENNTLNFDGFDPGLYFIKVELNTLVFSKTLIVH